MKFRAPKWARDIREETSQNDCEEYAPFLMALFDGEADDISARRARAHLLVCERCAHAWLDWNQTRSLLISEPVPAPPPTFMWRILMACRINAQARSHEHSATVARPTAPKPDLTRSPLVNGEGAPTDLAALILSQTTRTAASAPLLVTPRRARPVSPAYRSLRLRWKTAPMLAMPALAAFLLFSSRTDWLTPMTQNGVPDTIPLSSDSLAEANFNTASSSAQKPQLREGVSRHAKSSPVVPVHTAPVGATRSVPVVLHHAASPDTTPERTLVLEHRSHSEADTSSVRRVREERPTAVERNIETVSYRPHVDQERDTSMREVTPEAKTAAHPIPSKIFNASISATGSAALPKVQFASFRSAEFSDDAVAPRPSLTRSVAPERRVPILHQASLDTGHAPLRASAPVASDAKVRLISTSPAPDSDDSHIDELPSAVQDFRATLADDSTDWSSDDAG